MSMCKNERLSEKEWKAYCNYRRRHEEGLTLAEKIEEIVGGIVIVAILFGIVFI